MDISSATQFLRQHHRGVLITYRAGGAAQSSPVVAAIDSDGDLVISSREPAYKVRNLRRDPRATYCGFTDAFFGQWVQVDGSAQIVSLPDAMDGLIEYYRSISGEHPDWDDYRKGMERERRVLIKIRMEQAGPNRSG